MSACHEPSQFENLRPISVDSTSLRAAQNSNIWIDAGAFMHDDAAQFAARCNAWKTRGATIVLPLQPHLAHDNLSEALRLCAAHQLPVWLRIEYSNELPDQAQSSYIAFQTFDVSRGALTLFENVDEVVSAVAVAKTESDSPASAPRLLWSQTRDITRDFSTHARNAFRDITDDYGQARVFLWSRESENRFDVLDRAFTQNALSSTRCALQTLLDTPEIRAMVRGLCVDVAPLWDENAPDATRRFPWHDDLPRVFEALHGAPLPVVLPSLVADSGAAAARVRLDFWRAVSQLQNEHFAQPWRALADEHALALRFDFACENLHHATSRYGDIAEIARHADCCALGLEKPTSSTRSVLRLLSSLQEWRNQTPDLTQLNLAPPTFARASHALALPARHALWHDGATALETARDLSDNAQNEILLSRYCARHQRFLRRGRSGARVAVLWPSRSLQSHHHPKAHRFVRWVEEDLNATMQLLDSLHLDFLMLPENELNAAFMEDRVLEAGAFHAANLNCGASKIPIECVVLPSITCLSRAAWNKLEEFAQRGGKVVCLGLLPRWSEHGRDEQLEKTVESQTRTNIEDVYTFYRREEHESLSALHQSDPSSVGYPVVRQTASGGRISTYQPRLNPDADDARLRVRGLLTESVASEIETQSSAIKHRVRIDAEQTLFWTWNDESSSQRAHLMLRPLPLRPLPLRPLPLRPHNGEIVSVAHLDLDENRSSSINDETLNAQLPKALSPFDDEKMRAPTSTRSDDATSNATLDNIISRAVWMAMPALEGGGVAFSQQYASDETQLFVLHSAAKNINDETSNNTAANEKTPHREAHLESATFEVETFDGKVARGYVAQSGAPSVSWREGGKSRRVFGAHVTVPSPILLDEDWRVRVGAAHDKSHIEYSMSVVLPDEWRRNLCEKTWRVVLQIVPSQSTIAAQVEIENRFSPRRLTAPWIFEIESLGKENQATQIAVSLWRDLQSHAQKREADESEIVARLVAYPLVELAVTKTETSA